jgi:hypothetical protein
MQTTRNGATYTMLAIANANLATWVSTGNTTALLQGMAAAKAVLQLRGAPDLANADVAAATSYQPDWYHLVDLTCLVLQGANAMPTNQQAMDDALGGYGHGTMEGDTFAEQLALLVEDLADVPWLVAMRDNNGNQQVARYASITGVA